MTAQQWQALPCGVMHQLHVTQANKGCDFDFLETPDVESCESHAGEPEIH